MIQLVSAWLEGVPRLLTASVIWLKWSKNRLAARPPSSFAKTCWIQKVCLMITCWVPQTRKKSRIKKTVSCVGTIILIRVFVLAMIFSWSVLAKQKYKWKNHRKYNTVSSIHCAKYVYLKEHLYCSCDIFYDIVMQGVLVSKRPISEQVSHSWRGQMRKISE